LRTEKKKLVADLQQALAEIKTLHGILPICSGLQRRSGTEEGAWHQLETYISKHSDTQSATVVRGLREGAVCWYYDKARNKKNNRVKISDNGAEFPNVAAAGMDQGAIMNEQGKRDVSVLYVEDDSETREEVTPFPEPAGAGIDDGENGRDGLALYRQKHLTWSSRTSRCRQ